MQNLIKRLAFSIIAASVIIGCRTGAAAQTNEPPREPVLRIETGMHTDTIRGISVDAAGRFLATSSDDKTVRIWEAASGRLLRVIRPPIGEGVTGNMQSVAISPDGNTVIAGGQSYFGQDKTNSLYVFDRTSGNLTRRLSDVSGSVLFLTYSRDGKYFAATLGGRHGVRVYDAKSFTLIGADEKYFGDSYGADFDGTGRLVTTSFDGFLRVYAIGENYNDPAANLHLLLKYIAPHGNMLFAVKFSPDSTRIALGYGNSTKFDVLSAKDLQPVYSPDTTGVNGPLYCVAWSGDKIYAGGGHNAKAIGKVGDVMIRVWDDEGHGAYRDVASTPGRVFRISRLIARGDGGVFFASEEPAFGAIDARGTLSFAMGSPTADFRFKNVPVSLDGMNILFAYDLLGQSPAGFSVAERQLETPDTSPTAPANLRGPILKSPNLDLTNWRNSYEPKLNGKSLRLAESEKSQSVAIAPDEQSFLVGTDFYLRLYDRNGAERWHASVLRVWGVNVSGDGKLAIAALGDGTVRWYRMADGKELLALFPHVDKKRWVLWTPSGFYDASPGAEDLIGWHLNNGRDAAADFFPIGRFRSTAYRPDVIAKILGAGDEHLALKQANEEAGRKTQQVEVAHLLPPVVEIITPQDASTFSANEISVRFRVRTPSGEPVTNVRVLVDGRPSGARGLQIKDAASDCLKHQGAGGSADGGICETRVVVSERDALVSIIAENKYAASVPSTISLKWRGKPAPANSPNGASKPKLYVLAIGVSKYQNKDYALSYPAKDAQDFAAVWMRQKGGLYSEIVERVLTDEKASKDAVLDGLEWITQATGDNDTAIIFFAGHGVNDQSNDYYFLPANADVSKLKRTCLASSDIRTTVRNLKGKTLFFVDTCHSGNALGSTSDLVRRDRVDVNGFVNELSSAENGVIVFAASTGKQESLESATWNNGAFTKALVEGLNGEADVRGKGFITVSLLEFYISDRVKELTKDRQTPVSAKPSTVTDYQVALKK